MKTTDFELQNQVILNYEKLILNYKTPYFKS